MKSRIANRFRYFLFEYVSQVRRFLLVAKICAEIIAYISLSNLIEKPVKVTKPQPQIVQHKQNVYK